MQELINRIVGEIEDSLTIPCVSDRDLREIVGFVLTVAFAMLREEGEKIR
ncbi:MAG: hypothetical protein WC327_02050 [Candidatus Cloacimonadia bacterium]|jgi:hypothetical protein